MLSSNRERRISWGSTVPSTRFVTRFPESLHAHCSQTDAPPYGGYNSCAGYRSGSGSPAISGSVSPSKSFDVARLVESGVESWQRFIHPNGASYWAYGWNSKVSVISDIEPPLITQLQFITEAIKAVARELLTNPSNFDDWEIYVTAGRCTYIQHELRIASGKEQSFAQFRAQVENITNVPINIQLRYESIYWAIVESHPSHRILPAETIQDVKRALTWCYADRVLYEASNAPFEKENARELLDLMQTISNNDTNGLPSNDIQTWYCASVMRTIIYDRRHSHYGRRRAAEIRRRAQSNDLLIHLPFNSLVEWTVWHIAGILGFGSPFGYLKRINNVDRTVIQDGINTIRWRSFLEGLCKEWKDSNLLATVLVSGTVALLAIPGLNGLAQIAGLLSALCALSSVLSGTLLVLNHQSRVESSSKAAFVYFERAKLRGLGTTRPLAVILSLPVSLMLWGMFWFVFAIAACAVESGLPGISGAYMLSTRIILLSFVLAFVVLGVFTIIFLHNIWGSSGSTPDVKRPHSHPLVAQMTNPPHLLAKNQDIPIPSDQVNDSSHTINRVPHLPPAPSAMAQPFSAHSRTVGFNNRPPRTRVLSTVYSINSTEEELEASGAEGHASQAHSTGVSDSAENTESRPQMPGAPPAIPTSLHPPVVPPSSSPDTMEAPVLSVFPYPDQPSAGLFIDLDLRQAIPTGTAIPSELRMLRRGSQLTLVASTGQTALLLTAQNEALWEYMLEDDLRYASLVASIRDTCEQYGPIKSVAVHRQTTQQIGIETVGQACIQFARAEDASRALRGFMDDVLVEHCPVSARLLTEEEGTIWGIAHHTFRPDLPILAEDNAIHENATYNRASPVDEHGTKNDQTTKPTTGDNLKLQSPDESMISTSPNIMSETILASTSQPSTSRVILGDSIGNTGHHIVNIET
ncbi:hypothetical protein FRC09_001252 [Ceratobasidium sp. 395]|nr:hypothetical protein FRC09_001252 [Ceratobasidium sp. 395]